MKLIYTGKERDGTTARVYYIYLEKTYHVRYFTRFGIHLDGSDFECNDRDYAIMMATPENEEFLDHYEAYYGRNV